MVDMTNTLEVAHTILEQLGGSRFITMTGARNILGDANSVSFRLPGAGGFCKNGINYVKITPRSFRHLYCTVLSHSRHADQVSRRSVRIYADALRDIFTSVTGLAVSL
jgi:hypothetical protein